MFRKIKLNLPGGEASPLKGNESTFHRLTVEKQIEVPYTPGNPIYFGDLVPNVLRGALIQSIRSVPPLINAAGYGVAQQGDQPIATPENRILYWSQQVWLTVVDLQERILDNINLATITPGLHYTELKGQIPFLMDLTKSYLTIRGYGTGTDLLTAPAANPLLPNVKLERAICLEFSYIPPQYVEILK